MRLTRLKLMAIAMVLGLCLGAILSGCGSSGGSESPSYPVIRPTEPTGDDDDDTDGVTSNLTGTVYSGNGFPVSGVPVSVFSDKSSGTSNIVPAVQYIKASEDSSEQSYQKSSRTTDDTGVYAFSLSEGTHTVMVSRSGYVDSFRIVEVTSTAGHTDYFLLRNSLVSTTNVVATSSYDITSNTINGNAASLAIPVQSSGKFKVEGQDAQNAAVSVELLGINDPIPFPLPSVKTRSSQLNNEINADYQAPRVLVAIKPALLTMDTAATLSMPKPTDLSGNTKILHFDPISHQWEDTGKTIQDLPIPITEGGIYGIFSTSETEITDVKGSGFNPGSIIFVGDKQFVVGSDGTVYIEGVHIPKDNTSLKVVIIDPNATTDEDKSKTTSVKPVAGVPAEIQPPQTVIPDSLRLSADKNSVVTDGEDSATVTATVLDSKNVPIQGITVIFSTTGGQISASEVVTDENGLATITFSAGKFEKQNQTVTIEASVQGVEDTQRITIRITGTTVVIPEGEVELEIGGQGGGDRGILEIQVLDAAEVGVQNARVDFTSSPSNIIQINPADGYSSFFTDVNGKLKVEVTGVMAGETTLWVESMGSQKSKTYKVGSIGEIFGIIDPQESTVYLNTNQTLTVTVNAPEPKRVMFATTLGGWDGVIERKTITKSRDANNHVSAVLSTDKAGIANVQVFYEGQSSPTDILTVAIAAPSSEAAQIALQATPTVVPISEGDVFGESTVIAVVRNANDQAVGEAPVMFTMDRLTGGGESLNPVVVFTDSSGRAETKFTSGSLPSGANGIEVTGTVLGTSYSDSVNIVIGGQPASLVLGRSSSIESAHNDTEYRLPMSVTVSDPNGNAVKGAKVYLSAWPASYATGFWVEIEEGKCETQINGIFSNEDLNRNGILESAEDANGDGALTPEHSAVGTLPSDVTTGDNGVAEFYLTYPKASAAWIQAEITASTEVTGSETKTTYKFWLPVLDGEQCHLPDSRYTSVGNVGEIQVVATPNNLTADGISKSVISALVLDVRGYAVADGENIKFTAKYPDGSEETRNASTINGTASINFTAPSGMIGPVEIKAEASNGVYGETTIWLVEAIVGSIEMTTGSTSIVADGQSNTQIRVTVKDTNGNTIADGTQVSFTTSAGTIELVNNGETSGGIAQAVLTSSTSVGTATITATVGGSSQSVTVEFIPGPVAEVQIRALPNNLTADGQSVSTIRAEVYDAQGNAVEDGQVISFSITKGTGFLSAPSATTNGGVATIGYVASKTPGTETIVAKATNGVSGTVNITLVASLVGQVTLTVGSSSVIADGSSRTLVRADVVDSANNPVPDGTVVSFAATAGSLDNATAQTVNGAATTYLTSPSFIGSGTVTATAGGVSDSVSMTFIAGPPNSIELILSINTLPADGTSTAAIRARVTDANGNNVNDGESVTFTASRTDGQTTGFIDPPTATTSAGYVDVTYTASRNPGTETITARASNGITSSPKTITLNDSGIGAIVLSPATADNAKIPADGTSSVQIEATVTDSSGKPVPMGTSVRFETNQGQFSNGSQVIVVTTPDTTGVATASLISSTTPGMATIVVSSGGLTQSTIVEFTGQGLTVASIDLRTLTSFISADGSSKTTVTATVKSANNQAVPDAEVTFSITRGTITTPHTTDQNGQATAEITSARYNDNNVVITATCQGVTATTSIAFRGVTMTIDAEPSNLLANADASSEITLALTDAVNNAIPGADIILTTNRGAFSKGTDVQSITLTTDSSGQVHATLYCETSTGVTSGVATVSAARAEEPNKIDATVDVNFTQYDFRLSVDKTTIRISETATVEALLLDSGSPVLNQTVEFASSLGSLIPQSDLTDIHGNAYTVLTPGTQSGTATIDGYTTIVTPSGTTTLSDTVQVIIVGGNAYKIVLTVSPYVIPTQTGEATVKATVWDQNDQPAGLQNIFFRIAEGPGGGEYLSHGVAQTNTDGVATIKFYSGSLPSTLNGVVIEANTAGDFTGSFGRATLTISGPVANISIGDNRIAVEAEGGHLIDDITAIVTDIHGNPVADGTVVNFSVASVGFDEDRDNDCSLDCWDQNGNSISCPPSGTTGFGVTWFSDDTNQDGGFYNAASTLSSCFNSLIAGPMAKTEDINNNGILDSEDINGNGILDAGEDTNPPNGLLDGEDKNGNGVIDPINSGVIGSNISSQLGLARTTLIYPQSHADNIRVRVTAEAGGVTNFFETVLLCTRDMIKNETCGLGY